MSDEGEALQVFVPYNDDLGCLDHVIGHGNFYYRFWRPTAT